MRDDPLFSTLEDKAGPICLYCKLWDVYFFDIGRYLMSIVVLEANVFKDWQCTLSDYKKPSYGHAPRAIHGCHDKRWPWRLEWPRLRPQRMLTLDASKASPQLSRNPTDHSLKTLGLRIDTILDTFQISRRDKVYPASLVYHQKIYIKRYIVASRIITAWRSLLTVRMMLSELSLSVSFLQDCWAYQLSILFRGLTLWETVKISLEPRLYVTSQWYSFCKTQEYRKLETPSVCVRRIDYGLLRGSVELKGENHLISGSVRVSPYGHIREITTCNRNKWIKICLVKMEIPTDYLGLRGKFLLDKYYMYVSDTRSSPFDLPKNQEPTIGDAMSHASEIVDLHIFPNETKARSTDMQVRIGSSMFRF